MKLKVIKGMVLTLFLASMLALTFNIQPVKTTGTIYILGDASVDPPTAPISEPQRTIDLLKLPRLVMAFYHDWYGNTTGPTGEWVHWNHPIWDTRTGEEIGRHNPETFISPNLRDIGAANYPTLGPYDNRDPEVIKWHIKLALEAGIDVFIIDWWGDTTGEELTDVNMETMMDVNEEEDLGMKFLILFDGLWIGPRRPTDETIKRLEYVIEKYGSRPSYLKIQGFPVVFIYSASVYSPATWKNIINKIIGDGYNAFLFGDAFSEEYAKVFDGLQNYSPSVWIDQNQNLTNIYLEYGYLARAHKEPLGLAVLPGYDDTKVRRPGMVIPRENGAIYNATWKAVFASGCQWALICSWNEWHEGTEIEPSVEYGDFYLNLTKYYSEHFRLLEDVPVEMRPPLKEEVPFWMQWWFWAIVETGIAVLAIAVYFLKKRKASTPTVPAHKDDPSRNMALINDKFYNYTAIKSS